MAKNNTMETLLTQALAIPVKAGPISGCGRAYVVFSGEKAQIKEVAKAAKVLNRIFQKKAYGVGDQCSLRWLRQRNGARACPGQGNGRFLELAGSPMLHGCCW